ncbi:MAG: hypothetical protein K8H88_28015 [Sandaracinaceae bacterium]|nr:hypothetical protein [Sandaracinaceae bacterium]
MKARFARGEAELQPRELESKVLGELLSALALGADRATAALAIGIEDLDAQLAADPSVLKRVQQVEAKAELQRIARATLAAQQGDRRAAAWLRERQREPAREVESPPEPARTTEPSGVHVRSEGQRLLQAVPASHAEIAAALGTTKQAVSYWRRGNKTPDLANRLVLRDRYGIAPDAWEQLPSTAAAGAPAAAAPPMPVRTGSETTLDEVELQLAQLHQIQAGSLIASERVRLADAVGKLLALKARLERERELIEDRIVREHPVWKRIRERLTATLRPFPDAARAVAQALEELDA